MNDSQPKLLPEKPDTNPVIAFSLTPAEHEWISKLADTSGVTVAQMARGVFRYGRSCGENSPKLSPMFFITRGKLK